jgi:hypothetical protein
MSGLSTTVVVASTSVQLRDQALAGPKVLHAGVAPPARRSETYLSLEFERQSVEVVRALLICSLVDLIGLNLSVKQNINGWFRALSEPTATNRS